MKYRIYVQSMNDGPWSHYGDCASWAEVQKEVRGHIRFCGLYHRVEKIA